MSQAASELQIQRIDTRRDDAVVYLTDVYRGGGLAGVPRGSVKQLRLFAFDYGYHGLANQVHRHGAQVVDGFV